MSWNEKKEVYEIKFDDEAKTRERKPKYVKPVNPVKKKSRRKPRNQARRRDITTQRNNANVCPTHIWEKDVDTDTASVSNSDTTGSKENGWGYDARWDSEDSKEGWSWVGLDIDEAKVSFPRTESMVQGGENFGKLRRRLAALSGSTADLISGIMTFLGLLALVLVLLWFVTHRLRTADKEMRCSSVDLEAGLRSGDCLQDD